MPNTQEVFPVNIKRHELDVLLGAHYRQSLQAMGLEADAMPDCLFFTFCGDILGSSGAHYQKGAPISFDEARRTASVNFSDDFMESLAMHRMPRIPANLDLPTLMHYRDIFHDFIKDHFEAASLTYSPWFGALFNAATTHDYGEVLRAHSSCGAAMRAAVLAADGHDDVSALPYFLISHAHQEAIEGAYAILGLARAAKGGFAFDQALQKAETDMAAGRRLCANFQKGQGWTPDNFQPFAPLIAQVLKTNNPYVTIESIEEEGIETRFVVPAAILCLRDGLKIDDDMGGLAHIISKGLEIGGDPDTICSIASGLYGFFRPGAMEALKQVRIGSAS